MQDIFHVIVVEDDVSLGAVIAARLRPLDLKVTVLRDGTDAVRRIQQETPDMLVLDLSVPGVNGLEIAETIHNSVSIDCEVILYTGCDVEALERRAAIAGIRILQKTPGSLFTLQTEISRRCQKRDCSKIAPL